MKPEAKEIKEISNGRFVLGAMVGKGAFGQIYKAMDNVNKKEVAVKIVNAYLGKQDFKVITAAVRVKGI
jgi:hypothetical protein